MIKRVIGKTKNKDREIAFYGSPAMFEEFDEACIDLINKNNKKNNK